MPTMETELQRLNPELWNSYEHSYNKAIKEWLPLVNSNQGSSNALPHLIGVKQHIDNLLFGENLCEIELSAAELYVLLCAVLMHDIGKAEYFKKNIADRFREVRDAFLCSECAEYREQQKNGSESKIEHAQTAHYIVANRWYDLGLYNDKLSRIIARVCCFHDCPHAKKCKLNDEYYVEGFGKIRARTLGALLLLGDHLDDSFSRSAPDYFAGFTNDIGSIGKFRSKIQYIRFDKSSKMICSVIDPAYIREEDFYYSGDVSLGVYKKSEAYAKYKRRNCGIKQNNALIDYLWKRIHHENSRKLTEIRGIECSIIGDLFGHTSENHKELDAIRNELHILGMPIKKWMLECDGHIFEITYDDVKGKGLQKTKFVKCEYALEPTIDEHFCGEVFAAMINISLAVFGRRVFTYYDILNYMHDFNDDLDRVKTAVRRIERILSFHKATRDTETPNDQYELYMNENIWTLLNPDGKPKNDDIIGILHGINHI